MTDNKSQPQHTRTAAEHVLKTCSQSLSLSLSLSRWSRVARHCHARCSGKFKQLGSSNPSRRVDAVQTHMMSADHYTTSASEYCETAAHWISSGLQTTLVCPSCRSPQGSRWCTLEQTLLCASRAPMQGVDVTREELCVAIGRSAHRHE